MRIAKPTSLYGETVRFQQFPGHFFQNVAMKTMGPCTCQWVLFEEYSTAWKNRRTQPFQAGRLRKIWAGLYVQISPKNGRCNHSMLMWVSNVWIYIYIYHVWDDPNQAHAGGWYTNINHHLLGEVSIYVRECARIYPSQKKQAKESLLLYRNGQWAAELQYSVYRYRITLKYLDSFGPPPDTAIFQRSVFRVATSKT